MKILVINGGSSSIKFQLFAMEKNVRLASGLVERIGEKKGRITYARSDWTEKKVFEKEIINHNAGMQEIVHLLEGAKTGVIKNVAEIGAIGHRVVHGGEDFHEPIIINEKVLQGIEKHIPLAPLHNPVNLLCIKSTIDFFPGIPQVAVFDTAFHQSIPAWAYHYAIPHEYYTKWKVRKYGFHGTSHFYIAKESARYLGKDLKELNLITVHLGNGCSITAIEKGRSVDTSMGMTPLEGLIMGTRSGDLDPGISFFIENHGEDNLQEVENILNKKSGLKGVCGKNDMRDILSLCQHGDVQAMLALNMYTYRIKKYIGAYMAVLGKVDAIIFTAGVGENSWQVREMSLRQMDPFGIVVDPKANKSIKSFDQQNIYAIQTAESKIKILVAHTNEEMEIALQTLELVGKA